MIAEDLRALFADLKKDINGIKSDLILIKYDIEQMDKKLNELKTVESLQETDPFKDSRFTQL